MRNWIQTKGGVTNLPISYVIHKDIPPLTMDHSKLIIYNKHLTSAVLKSDSRKVANILTSIVLDTDAFECGGRKFSKGREVYSYLVINYNRYDNSECRIEAAIHKLSNLLYNNDMTFNFETLSTKLKSTFDTKEKYGEGRSEQ